MLSILAATTPTTPLVAKVNWSVPTWDLFIYLFFVIAVVIYGLSLGRDRILAILVSVYMALAVATSLPYITDEISQKFGFGPAFVLRILVFLGFIVGLFLLFSKIGLVTAFGGKAGIVLIGLFSFLHVGLLISCILSFLPPTAMNALAPITKAIFTSNFARFFWIVAPILAMFLVKPKAEVE